MNVLLVCVLVSSISFIFYGISYFISPHMKNEFERFKLEKLALLVILLEILGALGLLLGLWYEPLLLVSSGGLGLLMFLGLIVRMKLKDSLWISLPALFYMGLNAYIFYLALRFK
ncbi:hypothetical protein [Flavobacterium sp.]|uniref:hypothetical protein n=1 Tax=Flavobacterium sp. TaxID=239 RepID=UPI00286E796D|nr:hypothetical protein [Flavobacterium sp.]